jgi:hypothetical protein
MAQGLMAPIAIAAPSRVPSVAEHIPNSIGATALIGTSTTLPNYTSLTDVTTRYDRCAHTFFSAICIAAAVTFWLG